MAETKEIAAFNSKLEADLAVARLADAGFDAIVLVDNAGGTVPLMQMTTGGYRVHVATADVEWAQEVLEERFDPVEWTPPTPESFLQTGSIEWTRNTRFWVAVAVLLATIAALAVAVPLTMALV